MKREEREVTLESSTGREKKERGSIFTVRVLQRQVEEIRKVEGVFCLILNIFSLSVDLHTLETFLSWVLGCA